MVLVYDPLYVPLDALPLLYPDEPSDKSQDSGIKSETAQVDDESWDNVTDSAENEIDDGDDEDWEDYPPPPNPHVTFLPTKN